MSTEHVEVAMAGTPRSKNVSIFLGLVLCIAIGCRIWLTSEFAPSFINFDVDDALYVKQAASILDGEWLGQYDHRLLTKGPGYALFLAGNASLGLPRRFSESLFHGLACLALFVSFRRIGLGRTLATLLFLLTLFHPVMYGEMAGRVLRDGFYSSLTVLILALGIGILAPAGWFSRLLQALGLGLALTLFWVTRGEGIWLVPSLFILALGFLIVERERGMAQVLTQVIILMVVPAAMVFGGVEAWNRVNDRHYGMSVAQELQEENYNRAMGALQRVACADWQRYEPLSAEARSKIYAVSPTFASLRNWIESPAFRERHMVVESGDRMAVFLTWSIRTAVMESGQAKTPADASDFYRKVAEEIESGIESGTLAADPKERNSQYPAFRTELFSPFRKSLTNNAVDLFALDRLVTRPLPRLPRMGVATAERERFERVVGREFGSGVGGLFKRADLGERIRHGLSLGLPWAGFLGLLAMIVSLIRRRRLSVMTVATLSLLVAVVSRITLVAGLEAAWFADIENYLVAAYLLLPAVIVAALGTLWPRIPGVDRFGWFTGIAVLLLLGAGGWIYLQDSPDAEILEPSVEARLLGKSGADILLVRNALAYEVKRGLQVARREGLCEIVWHRSQTPSKGPTELIIDADFERVPAGTPWGIAWHPQSGPNRLDQARTLYVKKEGKDRWRIPLGEGGLERLSIRPPLVGQSAFLFERLQILPMRSEDLRDPTEATLSFEAGAENGSVTARLEGGEAESRYEVYFAAEALQAPTPYPERDGLAHIDVANLLAGPNGAEFKIVIFTDGDGQGQATAPIPSWLPESVHAQALGRRTLSKATPWTRPAADGN